MNEKFTIEVIMEERWIDHFMSFLKEMEKLGKVGASELIGFYADGDGDFKPQFITDIHYETKEKKNNGFVDFYDAE
jgi:hypothetical protein